MQKITQMDNVYVTKILKSDEEFSEIDFDLYKEFGFNFDDFEDFVEIKMGQGGSDGYPIKIDRMIEHLQSIKANGVTHVELDYHCDHIGYVISGFEMRPSTPEEIVVFMDKETTQKNKENKIAELYAEIRKLQKQ